ncbi:MAG: hypothetical protein AAB131_00200 [Actinomycetota bacterium]|jgi:hypothetical protein|nr:MAG: Uncharacterized protein FD127_564 [Acidimicrobiaceae bacterium]
MSITIEELAARLSAEASRRGITVDALVDELAGKLAQAGESKPVKRRLAFVGIGASSSGRSAREADEMLAEGFGRPPAC